MGFLRGFQRGWAEEEEGLFASKEEGSVRCTFKSAMVPTPPSRGRSGVTYVLEKRLPNFESKEQLIAWLLEPSNMKEM